LVTGASFGGASALGAAMTGLGISGTASSILPGALEGVVMDAGSVGDDLQEWYDSYASAIDKANQEAAEAESKYLRDVTDANYDKWQKKLTAANTLQQELYTNLEKLQGYVNNLEYNDATKATIDGFNQLVTNISLQGVGDDIQSKISHIQS
ncbi:hypothetical protein, partial [Escherichia coli]|uniref:hypothetical protein n=1 Tax=Escherichia coli TaxID=562 RepID=UPI00159F0830